MASGRRYRICNVAGKGAFGTVYRAMHIGEGGFQKEVAVKILHEENEGFKEIASRLRDEARLLGLIHHRAFPMVDGLVKFKGRWAIVGEYVPGATLLQVARAGAVPARVVVDIGAELGNALHAAYTREGPDGRPLKAIHRDIKLSNIMMTAAGDVKLLDLGVAKADYPERESETFVALGTRAYMSPERLRMIDGPAGDVYALAAVMLEMMAGRRFGQTNPKEKPHGRHVDKAMEMLKARVDETSPELESLLLDALQHDATARPTAREFEMRCRELRGTLSGPLFSEWANKHVPHVMSETGLPDDPICGETYVEDVEGEELTPGPREAQIADQAPPTNWTGIAGAGLLFAASVAIAVWAFGALT